MNTPSVSSQRKQNLQNIKTSTNLHFFAAWALVFLGLGIAIWGGGRLMVEMIGSEEPLKWEHLAGLGSFLAGPVVGLWTLAGFIFVYIAFLGQEKQSIEQEIEIEHQRRQFQLQHDSLKRQNFENSLFQLINLHSQNLRDMRIYGDRLTGLGQEIKYEGRACFKEWYGTFEEDYRSMRPTQAQHEDITFVAEQYGKFYTKKQPHLGHYFRTLYHIFKFIHESEVPNKRRYTSLVRAQLSAYELVFLFYNGIHEFGEKFKPLIEDHRYALLEQLDDSILLKRVQIEQLTEEHPHKARFYRRTAFKAEDVVSTWVQYLHRPRAVYGYVFWRREKQVGRSTDHRR